MKVCTKCKRELEETNFRKSKHTHDKLYAKCRDCTKASWRGEAEC